MKVKDVKQMRQIGTILMNKKKNDVRRLLELSQEEKDLGATHCIANDAVPYIQKEDGTLEPNPDFIFMLVKQITPFTVQKVNADTGELEEKYYISSIDLFPDDQKAQPIEMYVTLKDSYSLDEIKQMLDKVGNTDYDPTFRKDKTPVTLEERELIKIGILNEDGTFKDESEYDNPDFVEASKYFDKFMK